MAETEEISKEILQKEISEILQNVSLDKTSTKKVIQKLEQKLGVNLSEKKKLIDQLVMDYVNSMESEETEEEGEVVVKKNKNDEEDDERDDSNDSDWGSRGKKKVEEKKKTPTKATPKGKKGGGGGGGGVAKKGKRSGYTRSYKLSPALAELMGKDELPRHTVVKRIWAIIKEKQLFDPNNRQFTICDKELFKVIGEKRFHTFSMMKYLKTHFLE